MGLFVGFLVDGLGLGAFGLKFECFGPKLKVSDLSNLLWRSFRFSCIRNSHFLIIGLSSRASNREVSTVFPLDFLKKPYLCIQIFSKNQHAMKHTHTTYKKNTYLILTFSWGCRFTNQLPLGNNLNSRSPGKISRTLSSPILQTTTTNSTGE